jgi:hypothetical protein
MKKDDIRTAITLRVISSHGLGAPVGSLATVQSVETSRAGDWLCIVEYHDKKQPKHGTRLYRTHLWVVDLGRFEIVTDTAHDNHPGRKARACGEVIPQRPQQLGLPFEEGL